jgi:hypothetical protein
MAWHLERARAALFAGLAIVASCAASCASGCASTPNEPPPSGQGADPNVGSFSMQLTAGGGYRFGQVSYDVSGNGFHKAGSIDVAASATLSTVVGGIPFGTGYKLQLTTLDAAHALTPCTGSATFDITGAATTAVPVHLTCHEVPKATAVAAVPVPRWATAALAGLLLAMGATGARRRTRARR